MANWTKQNLSDQLKRVIQNGWLEIIQNVANQNGYLTAFWLAVGSRESNLKNLIGDKGNGFGVWQIDKRFEKEFTDNFADTTIESQLLKAIEIFEEKTSQIHRNIDKNVSFKNRSGKLFSFPGKRVENDDVIRIATSAYNCGIWAYYSYSTGKDIDQVSSHKDYGKDVYLRSLVFAELLEEFGIEENAVLKITEFQGKYFESKINNEIENMGIIPKNRPNIKEDSFKKVAKYFLGENWQEQHQIVELAIRQNRINFYDYELAVLAKGKYRTFNLNTEPAQYVKNGQAKAVLKKGVHNYCLSYHKKWDNSKRYVALNPENPNRQLPVWRKSGNSWRSDVGTAINQHKGGANSTWSEGCQTIPYTQYSEFIQLIGFGLGIKIPLGVVRSAKKELTDGIGKFPYILIDQADFNYIMNLPESDFDNAKDLKYQMKHFVTLPKSGQVRPERVEVENGEDILAEVEIDQIENDEFEEDKFEEDQPVENEPSSSNENKEKLPETETVKQKLPPGQGLGEKVQSWLNNFGKIPIVGTVLGGVGVAINQAVADGKVDFMEIVNVLSALVWALAPVFILVGVIISVYFGYEAWKEHCRQKTTQHTATINGDPTRNNIEYISQ